MNILLEGVVGSTAYGLSTTESDEDILGIFALSMYEFAGLDWHSSKETVVGTSEKRDFAYHEARKYLRLLLKCNPTILELLFLESYTTKHELGENLVELRKYALSEKYVQNSFVGYATAQLKKNQIHKKAKHARHTLRLIRQAQQLLSTGMMTLKVPDPQEYFDLTGDPEQLTTVLQQELTVLNNIKSVLPMEPNVDVFKSWLYHVRRLTSTIPV